MNEPHRCTAPLQEGDECSYEHSACPSGTSCKSGRCWSGGIPQGEPCCSDCERCDDGLICQPGDAEGSTYWDFSCEPRPTLDETCFDLTGCVSPFVCCGDPQGVCANTPCE
jgi:hypothetical protein